MIPCGLPRGVLYLCYTMTPGVDFIRTLLCFSHLMFRDLFGSNSVICGVETPALFYDMEEVDRMKVILQEDVKNLGKMGDVANVSDGYARNFLIPKKLAVEANVKNVRSLEHEKKKLEDKAKKIRNEAQGLSEKLSSLTLTLPAKAGEEEKLFGSITSKDIAEALKAQGLDIDRKKILLDEPIKRLGAYSVGVKVHQEVIAQVNVNIVPDSEGEGT